MTPSSLRGALATKQSRLSQRKRSGLLRFARNDDKAKPCSLFRERDTSRSEALALGAAAVKEDAGDDEHGRHRQQLRECRRGCPLGGVFHAGFLPKPGRDSLWRKAALHQSEFYSEHPAPSIRLDESPLGEVDCASLEQYCGGNLTPAWPPADSVLAK